MNIGPLALPVTEKLTRTNFNLWKAQVMPAIRGAQLEGLLDGSDEAPPKHITVQVDGKAVKKINEEYGNLSLQGDPHTSRRQDDDG